MLQSLKMFYELMFAWLPSFWVACISALVFLKLGDSMISIIDKLWRLIGR